MSSEIILCSDNGGILQTHSSVILRISFEKDIPYVTAIIKLAEGPHFLSNIVGSGSDEVYCDMPVEVTWEDVDEAFSLPKFKPDS